MKDKPKTVARVVPVPPQSTEHEEKTISLQTLYTSVPQPKKKRFRDPLVLPIVGTDSNGSTAPLYWIVILGHEKNECSEQFSGNECPENAARTGDSTTPSETPAVKPVVLVAEDTDSNYLLLNALLRKEYSLVRAVDGVEAVEMCRDKNPDIILMDVRMPRMNGLEATREIRTFNKTVPILALTAFAYDQDRRNATEAGCNGFLTKPVSPGDLRSAIKEWLKDK